MNREESRPLVSVVLPCFNAASTIRDALESVQSQSLREWEAIVVDDHSTDGCVGIVQELATVDPRIRLIQRQVNSGTPAVPRNDALRQATGSFVAFLDADDLWHRRKLEIQVAFLEENEEDACFTEVQEFREPSTYNAWAELTPKSTPTVRFLTHRMLLFKNFIRSGSSLMVRRRAGSRICFNSDPRYKGVEDYLYALRLHQEAIRRSYQLCLPLVGYRVAPGSISSSKIFMARQHFRLYRDYSVEGRKLGPKAWGYWVSYALLSFWQRVVRAPILPRWTP